MRKSTGAIIVVLIVAAVVLVLLFNSYGGGLSSLLTNPGVAIDRMLRGVVGSLAAFGEGLKNAFPRFK